MEIRSNQCRQSLRLVFQTHTGSCKYGQQAGERFIQVFVDYNVGKFIRKCDMPLDVFSPVSALFHKTLEKGWDDLTSTNKEFFFEGFEFARPLSIVRAESIEDLLPSEEKIVRKSRIRWFVAGCLNWLRI